MILEPMQVMVQLALLSFSPRGTKISIHDNIIILQPPTTTQGLVRWYNNDSKDDIYYLFKAVLRFYKLYRNKNDAIFTYILELAKSGLDQLSLTYSNTDKASIIHTLSMYKAVLKSDPSKFFNCDQAEIDDEANSNEVLPVRRELEHAAWMTIQSGCDNSCAFCIVPQVRGSEVSRPFGDLLEEAKRIVSEGVIEITLLGQNVNSYGRDLTTQLRSRTPNLKDQHLVGTRWTQEHRRRARTLFPDLLNEIGSITGIRRVRFTSPHPKDLRREVIQAMADTPAVCEHLHFPLQSGSDRILAAMHRGYNKSKYLERLAEARKLIPDLAVTTDIIVGFPGETEKDFQETLALAAEAEFDGAFTFIFSPRPGTEAAEMAEDFCDPSDISERYERLRAVIKRSGLRKHENRVGRHEEVIVEGPSKKNPALISGRTRQNKLVHFETPKDVPLGSVAIVEIISASSHYLHGRLLDVIETPKRKTRIPVVAV